jgi:polyprenyl-phospho-N-acetylgalactosaminyl synthase
MDRTAASNRHTDTVVVIPAFNESGRIAEVVAGVQGWFERVVVIDDGSRDDTAAAARQAGAAVLIHPVNLGQGAALQTGFEWARRQGADWVVTLDADGQHDPQEAAAMLQAARQNGWDVALGSRFLGRTEGMPASRRVLLKSALAFQNLTTGLRLTDVHNGLRVLSCSALQTIVLRQNRMAHASEIVSQIASSGLRIGEYPVTIRYTAYSLAKGQSALGALNILFDLLIARLGR